MQGFQLTFFTQQDRSHGNQPISEWLLIIAKDIGIRGGTVVTATEGLGHEHRIHSAHFFDLSDQPIEITFVASAEEVEKLFEQIQRENIRLFYVKTSVEFGTTGE